MKQLKVYTGSCYIGVVGNENENGQCRDSIEGIERKKSDTPPQHIRATKGFEARQMHLNNWYENTKHPFMLLLDHDMIFPPFTLARLRAHKLPYLSGLYMRRNYNPIAPVWFELGEPGQLPMKPWTAPTQDRTLYRLGASGWGCILIHRDVVTATRKLLKGEPEIIEDDMDLWPYDIKTVLKSLAALRQYGNGSIGFMEARKHIEILASEIRPLRGMKDGVGSDIRFPFFARLAGFEMIGDAGVYCDHMLNYPLNPNDYNKQPAEVVRDIAQAMHDQVTGERRKMEQAVRA